jgi:hypothetical protein
MRLAGRTLFIIIFTTPTNPHYCLISKLVQHIAERFYTGFSLFSKAVFAALV